MKKKIFLICFFSFTPLWGGTQQIQKEECKSPLKFEQSVCFKGGSYLDWNYTAVFLYVTGSTDKEKTACMKKYHGILGGCAYKLIASPYNPESNLSLNSYPICGTASLNNKMCHQAIQDWRAYMNVANHWLCYVNSVKGFHNVRDVNKEMESLHLKPPLTEQCPEENHIPRVKVPVPQIKVPCPQEDSCEEGY